MAAKIIEYSWEIVCVGGSFCRSRDLKVFGPVVISESGLIDWI